MTAVRSPTYLAGSRGAFCTLRFPGCQNNTETVVPCHARDRHTGRGIKASDLSVVDGCFYCHEIFDRRAKLPDGTYVTDADWHKYALRGLQETLERRVEMRLLTVAGNAADRPRRDRPVKPRKARADRKSLPQGRGFPEQHRPMKSRNNLRRSQP